MSASRKSGGNWFVFMGFAEGPKPEWFSMVVGVMRRTTRDFFQNSAARLVDDRYRCAERGVLKKTFCCSFGEADAAVRSGVAWEVSCVHSDAAVDSHEVGHRCAPECSARRATMGFYPNVGFNDIPRRIDIVAVKVRCVVFIFLDHLESAGRSAISHTASGNSSASNYLAAYEKNPLQSAKIDHD